MTQEQGHQHFWTVLPSLPTQSLCIVKSSFSIIPFSRELVGLKQHLSSVLVLQGEVNFSLISVLRVLASKALV